MKTTNEEPTAPAPKVVFSDMYPLDESYAARGETAPIPDRIEAAEVPEPYHSLLVHNADLTLTLEKSCGRPVHVEVLTRELRDTEYCREVILALDGTGRRVGFGGIKIFLDALPAEARAEILRDQLPLGRILSQFNIQFSSRPRAYLRLTSDTFIDAALGLQWPQLLYGRNSSLVDSQERLLAEIVEILPP
jgi:chorismate-pyruvate lyase